MMRLPQEPPPIDELLGSALTEDRAPEVLRHLRGPTVDGKYLHWDDLRHRQPPEGLSAQEWWLTLKLGRGQSRRLLPIVDANEATFGYVLTDEVLAMLHRVDSFASGRIAVPEAIANEVTRDRYLVSSLMEEAIGSSLLEGAATTRREAKEMLRSGRTPRTRSERMVLNNYRTMQQIRQDLDEPLTVAMILDLHRMVTEGTLDDPADAGRVQQPGERRVDVGDPFDQSIVFHRPPPAEELPRLLKSLVDFANAIATDPFLHPVVRAVALHFWLSYIHPFVDGNGRTARALFYRSMLCQGYWLAEFLSISRLLNQAPVKYARAFLHTESDGADFTYFLLHQLDVLSRAIDELLTYLTDRVAEVRGVERALRSVPGLNHRQLALLSHALRRPDAVYTIKTHQTSHNVAYQTARVDLLDLEARGLLARHVIGRQFTFVPTNDLAERIRAD